MSAELSEAVQNVIRANPDAGAAYRAMIGRGIEKGEAEAEIARVLVGCLHEDWNNPAADASGLTACLKGLERGVSAQELFPGEGELEH